MDDIIEYLEEYFINSCIYSYGEYPIFLIAEDDYPNPETKQHALQRAKQQGFPRSSVVKARRGGYYIAPKGVRTAAGKHTYAEERSRGLGQRRSAMAAWAVEKRARRRRGR